MMMLKSAAKLYWGDTIEERLAVTRGALERRLKRVPVSLAQDNKPAADAPWYVRDRYFGKGKV